MTDIESQLRADIERLEQESNFLAHSLMIVLAQNNGRDPECVGQDSIDFARNIARKIISGELVSMTLVQEDNQTSN